DGSLTPGEGPVVGWCCRPGLRGGRVQAVPRGALALRCLGWVGARSHLARHRRGGHADSSRRGHARDTDAGRVRRRRRRQAAARATEVGGRRTRRYTIRIATAPSRATVSPVLASGKAWTTREPRVGVAAGVCCLPNPRGKRTASSQNAPGFQAAKTAITGTAT